MFRSLLWSAACVAALLGPAVARADALDEMAQAERAFAAKSRAAGMVPAFREFMADDSVIYRPDPRSGRAHYKARPDKVPFALDWAPQFAEIAASGDFGYTTGPSTFTPDDKAAGEPSGGHFFSIWQRDASGRFLNVLDHGIGHEMLPLSTSVTRRGPAREAIAPALAAGAWAARQQSLLNADRALVRALMGKDGAQAWRAMANADVLVLREGSAPMIGPGQATGLASLPAMDLAVLRVSGAGDLGVTSGWGGDAKAPHVYIRVWRWIGSDWRIVADMLTP